jgi:Xaa-Pro aminopeptidase
MTEGRTTGGTQEPLIDRDRASFVLAAAGLDGLLLGRPESTYHATGVVQGMARFGVDGTTFALLPRDPLAPIIHITPQFGFYYMTADTDLVAGVEQRLVTWPDADRQAAQAALYLAREPGAISAREARRRGATTATAPFFASTAAALADALRGFGPAPRIGHDTQEGGDLLAICAPGAARPPAADIARHVRLVRTPREIALMRAASAANVAAALAIAPQMRSLGSLQAVRAAFNARVSALGNIPVFMAVDGVVDESVDAGFTDGQTALIDCVSQRAGYHGDFGRTIFIGEPRKAALDKARVVAAAWDEVRAALRPGLTFSQVRALGASVLARMGSDLRVPFQPHCVGLAHTDQPRFGLHGEAIDQMLEAGMTISVDCPLMEVGTTGTMHFEDLTLITADGSEPLHAAAPPFILA